MTEEEVWALATHVHCYNCDTDTRVAALGFTLESDVDLDDAYDYVDCCDAPTLDAQIHSDEPLFEDDDANEDALIRANPSLGILSDRYEYTVNDELLDRVKETA